MKVEIECKVKVVGATIEEALARMSEKLMVAQLYEADRERYAKGYHFWDEENDGEVDWTPIVIVNRSKDGAVQSEITMRVKNA